MQVEAIYDHGRLELPKHLRLRYQRFKVRLEIPRDKLVAEPEESGEAPSPADRKPFRGSFSEELRAILAPVRKHLAAADNQPLSKEERHELFYQEWEERHRDAC